MNRISYIFSITLIVLIFQVQLFATTKTATLSINSSVTYQKITGFGGFANSPQFAYDWMSNAEMKQLWGKTNSAGYNIMRIFIPIGESAWTQALATAKYAKDSLGVMLFASPWSMPAAWKTNNSINATYTSNNVVYNGYLNTANYADYANYLNNFVTYLSNNGVKLDAISIQNEPDEAATYAGCLWATSQIASFIAKYGRTIHCKIIAPESIGVSDNYASALLPDSVSNNFDIYAGHQYAGVSTGFQKLQAKGHEAWMTEYLINWNTTTTRDFSWDTDAFTFTDALNTALSNNMNAWIHYASKRYYGMIGDGTNGTTVGELTKRGYILSHYAKYTTGTTRIQNTYTDASGILKGTSYLSTTGDSIIVMIANSSTNSYTLTVNLPFYTVSGNSITTTASTNMSNSALSFTEKTSQPEVAIAPSCFTTLVFVNNDVSAMNEKISGNDVKIAVSDKTLNVAFDGCRQIQLFTISGQLIVKKTTYRNYIKKLSTGIYILKVNNKNYKFIVP